MRKLTMLLLLCLLAGMLPVGVCADEIETRAVEEEPPEAVGDVGAEGLYAEGEDAATDDAWEAYCEPEGDAAEDFLDTELPLVEDDDEAAVEAAPEDAAPEAPAIDADAAVEAVPHTDPEGPQLASNEIVLGAGETFALKGKMPAGNDSAITYSCTDSTVADVDADGLVTAVAPGDVTVTALAEDGTYAECFVSVRKAPDAVSFASAKFALGKGETTDMLKVVIGSAPGEYAGAYTLTSSKPKIVSVEKDGRLRGRKTGQAKITVKTYNGFKATCTVTVRNAPKKVSLSLDKPTMGLGETGQATCTLPSKTASSRITYTSDHPEVVTVDADGALTAVGEGTAKIKAAAFNGKSATATVTVKAAPVILSFDTDEFVMGVDMSVRSVAVVNEGAAAGIVYEVANPKIACFKDGALKALAVGTTTLTASTYNGLTATCQLVVKPKPKYVKLAFKTLDLYVGDEVLLTPDVGDSASTFTFSTSDKKCVSVTDEGVIKGLKKGNATITIKTYNKKSFKLKVVVSKKPDPFNNPDTELPVDISAVCLSLPARKTDIAGIPANLARIEDIRASAIGRIDAMRAAGIITEADADKRKSMVNNAFADYAFPWMTPSLQKYWKAANSEGGAKDFKPGVVYYGLPYISGGANNRRYNVKKALAESRYTDSGKGYYLLNKKKLLNKKYCGNDCSAFVDAAIWGTSNSHSADRTDLIASSKAYRTINDYGALRTGDLICKSGKHVVMFLYYAAEDKTKVMVIQNGGSEPAINTVNCDLVDTNYYRSTGYKIRRLSSLGK